MWYAAVAVAAGGIRATKLVVWKTYDPVKGIVAVMGGGWFGVGVVVVVERWMLDVRYWK